MSGLYNVSTLKTSPLLTPDIKETNRIRGVGIRKGSGKKLIIAQNLQKISNIVKFELMAYLVGNFLNFPIKLGLLHSFPR